MEQTARALRQSLCAGADNAVPDRSKFHGIDNRHKNAGDDEDGVDADFKVMFADFIMQMIADDYPGDDNGEAPHQALCQFDVPQFSGDAPAAEADGVHGEPEHTECSPEQAFIRQGFGGVNDDERTAGTECTLDDAAAEEQKFHQESAFCRHWRGFFYGGDLSADTDSDHKCTENQAEYRSREFVKDPHADRQPQCDVTDDKKKLLPDEVLPGAYHDIERHYPAQNAEHLHRHPQTEGDIQKRQGKNRTAEAGDCFQQMSTKNDECRDKKLHIPE